MISSYHRPTYAKVELAVIGENIAQIGSQLPKETNIWAVVKANAYGHGAIAVANVLKDTVYGFCVSNLDEALELRRATIHNPILVLGVVPVTDVRVALEANIEMTVASQEWLDALLALNHDLSGLGCHIKVDSGMGRIGFSDVLSINQAVSLMVKNGMAFRGIFTHFATADEQNQEQLQAQLTQFKTIVTALDYTPDMIHSSNSAAAIWHKETVFSAVRLGDAIYGLNPSGHALALPYPLKPALSLCSELVHVKEVSPGTKIGYGGTYQSSHQEWIGTVPIGYADGLTRNMQGFKVLVDGTFCEIVGRVSMDQITIRLPKAYPIGTKVTLIGENQGESISVQDWADYRSTINYEVVCLLTDRIPRRY